MGRRITPRPTRLLLHLSRCKDKGTHMGTLHSHHIHTPGRRKEAVKRGTTSFLQRNTHGNTIIDILQEGGKRQLGEEPRPIYKQLQKNCVGCANQGLFASTRTHSIMGACIYIRTHGFTHTHIHIHKDTDKTHIQTQTPTSTRAQTCNPERCHHEPFLQQFVAIAMPSASDFCLPASLDFLLRLDS